MAAKRKEVRDFAKTETVRARLSPAVKSEAGRVLRRLGMSHTEAITMLYQQIARRKGLPFSTGTPNAKSRKAIADADADKGKVYKDTAEMFRDMGV